MGRRYFYTTNTGDQLIPIADDSHETGLMSADYAIGNCFLQFFDADGVTPITPAGGTINFRSAGFDGQYLADSGGITVSAVEVVGTGDALYTPPSFDSVVVRSKMTLAGISGATFVKAYIWRA